MCTCLDLGAEAMPRFVACFVQQLRIVSLLVANGCERSTPMTARFPRSSVLRLLMILLLARAAHSYAKDKQKLDKGLQSIVNTLANWGEKISTPGAHAVLRPLKQSQANGKLMILYEL